MKIFELFDHNLDISDHLVQAALDFLTPLVSSNVPFVTIRQVTDDLRNTRPGIVIDRSLVMRILDPNTMKCVKKIEGDKVYLQQPDNTMRAVSDDQAEKDRGNIKDKAQDQAIKSIKN